MPTQENKPTVAQNKQNTVTTSKVNGAGEPNEANKPNELSSENARLKAENNELRRQISEYQRAEEDRAKYNPSNQ